MALVLVYAVLGVAVVALAWCFALSRRLSGATRVRAGSAEPPLALKVADRADALAERVASLEQEQALVREDLAVLSESLSTAIRHVGMTRYDALPGAAGEQSFSVAMLDDQRNGFVLTGIYGRSEYRVYAKPVADGMSSYKLSDEEQHALSQAREQEVAVPRGAR